MENRKVNKRRRIPGQFVGILLAALLALLPMTVLGAQASNLDLGGAFVPGIVAQVGSVAPPSSLTGVGMYQPFRRYQAQDAQFRGELLTANRDYAVGYPTDSPRSNIANEASGRQAVRLNNVGDYIVFTLTAPTNSIVLRYSLPDRRVNSVSTDAYLPPPSIPAGQIPGHDATLGLYLNNSTRTQSLMLSSRHSWLHGNYPFHRGFHPATNPAFPDGGAHRRFTETRMLLPTTLQAGQTIMLRRDASDNQPITIDFIETEMVEAPITRPAGSICIVEQGGAVPFQFEGGFFGRVPSNAVPALEAWNRAVAMVPNGGTLWIPPGNFYFPRSPVGAPDFWDRPHVEAGGYGSGNGNLTIQGAGMWHSNLVGDGAAFDFHGLNRFRDFSITGDRWERRDVPDFAAFENWNNASRRPQNVLIENIWVERTKVGIWCFFTDNLVVRGNRFRNIYADGINLNHGNHNALIYNNHFRNVGDDAMAIWPNLHNSNNNTIRRNTAELIMLANGIAIYGGADNVAEFNHIMDTVVNGSGICIGNDYVTPANSFGGTTVVRGNVMERTGSWHMNHQYEIGAIWIWNTGRHGNHLDVAFQIYNNRMYDSTFAGISIDNMNTRINGMTFTNNHVIGGREALFVQGGGTGSITINGLYVTDVERYPLTRGVNTSPLVVNGLDTIRIVDGGSIVLGASPASQTYITPTIDVTLSVRNPNGSQRFSINGGTPTVFTHGQVITIGSAADAYNTTHTLVLTADGAETRTFQYTRVAPPPPFRVEFENTQGWDNVFFWAWNATGGLTSGDFYTGNPMTRIENTNFWYFEFPAGLDPAVPITAMFHNGLAADAGHIRVYVDAIYTSAPSRQPSILTSLVVAPSPITLLAGATQTLTVTGYDQYGAVMAVPTPVTWASSNTATATVAGTAEATTLTGVAAGTANITVTAGGLTSAPVAVTVNAPSVSTDRFRVEFVNTAGWANVIFWAWYEGTTPATNLLSGTFYDNHMTQIPGTNVWYFEFPADANVPSRFSFIKHNGAGARVSGEITASSPVTPPSPPFRVEWVNDRDWQTVQIWAWGIYEGGDLFAPADFLSSPHMRRVGTTNVWYFEFPLDSPPPLPFNVIFHNGEGGGGANQTGITTIRYNASRVFTTFIDDVIYDDDEIAD